MGLFSSKTIYYVSLSTSKVTQEIPPNYFVSNIVSGVQNATDTTFTIYRAYNTGPSASLKRYMRYGKRNYTYGLPTVTTNLNFADYDALENVLELVEGEPVILNTVNYGVMSPELNAILYCYKYKNLDIKTRSITITTSSWIGGSYIRAGTYRFRTLENNGSTAVFVYTVYSSDYDGNNYSTDYYYRINNIPVIYEPGYWYIVLYEVASSSTIKFFEYKEGAGVYPSLDGYSTDVDEAIPPVAILRNRYKYVDQISTSLYEDTKDLLGIMNLPLDSFLDGLKAESQMNKVTTTSYVFQPNLFSTDPATIKYIYAFFDSLSRQGFITDPKAHYWDNLQANKGQYQYSYKIKEQFYDYKLVYNYIDKSIHNGSIGKKGKVTISYNINPFDRINFNSFRLMLGFFDDGSAEDIQYYSQVNSYIIIRKQVDTNVYEQLEVHGLAIITQLPQTNFGLQYNYVYMKDKADFLLPLIPDLLFDNLSIIDQESPIFEAMHMVLYAADQQKKKWYESFLGQLLITVVATFIAGPVGFKAGATWASVGVAAFVRQVAISFLIGLVISKVLLPVLGDNAILFAIAAFAVGYYGEGLMAGQHQRKSATEYI